MGTHIPLFRMWVPIFSRLLVYTSLFKSLCTNYELRVLLKAVNKDAIRIIVLFVNFKFEFFSLVPNFFWIYTSSNLFNDFFNLHICTLLLKTKIWGEIVLKVCSCRHISLSSVPFWHTFSPTYSSRPYWAPTYLRRGSYPIASRVNAQLGAFCCNLELRKYQKFQSIHLVTRFSFVLSCPTSSKIKIY